MKWRLWNVDKKEEEVVETAGSPGLCSTFAADVAIIQLVFALSTPAQWNVGPHIFV